MGWAAHVCLPPAWCRMLAWCRYDCCLITVCVCVCVCVCVYMCTAARVLHVQESRALRTVSDGVRIKGGRLADMADGVQDTAVPHLFRVHRWAGRGGGARGGAGGGLQRPAQTKPNQLKRAEHRQRR